MYQADDPLGMAADGTCTIDFSQRTLLPSTVRWSAVHHVAELIQEYCVDTLVPSGGQAVNMGMLAEFTRYRNKVLGPKQAAFLMIFQRRRGSKLRNGQHRSTASTATCERGLLDRF